MTEIISREDALARGLKRYFSGKPCKNGHISQRYCSGSGCLECSSNRAQTEECRKYQERYRSIHYQRRPRKTRKPRVHAAKITISQCVVCGIDYRKIGQALTCTANCGATLRRNRDRAKLKGLKNFNCEVCKTPFANWSPRAKFCSKTCRNVSLSKRSVARHRNLHPPKTKMCVRCAASFVGRWKRYCSEQCRRAARHQRDMDSRGPVTKACKICSSAFIPVGSQKMCSPACVEANNRILSKKHHRSEKGMEHKRRYMRHKRMDPVYKAKKRERKRTMLDKYKAAYRALVELGIEI